MQIKLRLLGTGTSQGVPVIGCKCAVCRSSDSRDIRLRTAALLSIKNRNILIDPGPDFRHQMLAAGIDRLDGILITHEHNDHVAGLDDIRPFYFQQKTPIQIYSLPRVNLELRHRFGYFFNSNYPGVPKVKLNDILPNQRLEIAGLAIDTLQVWHGTLPILGFRFGPIVYITDAKYLPDETLSQVVGKEILIINALHHRTHHTHFNLEEAIVMAKKIGAHKTFFTHISHTMGLHLEVSRNLPDGINLAFDGLEVVQNV